MKKRLLPLILMVAAGCQVPLALQDTGANASAGYWGQGATQDPAASQARDGVHPAAASLQEPEATTPGAVPTANLDPTQAAGAASQDSPLLGWGGDVVEAPRAGAVREVSRVGSRGLQESVEGRMHIIELYQSVLDERDQLLTEVDALQSALSKSQQQLNDERSQAAAQSTRIEALEEGKRRLLSENTELAGRLTTAQLRRLEAEKLLLETQLAWHQEKAEAAARSVAARLGSGGEQ